jgi:hypothetical protein
MLRFGAVLALFGFGSAVLHFTDIQFRLLSWAEKWQPWLGLIMGGVGALFLLIATLRNKDDAAEPPAAPQGYGPQAGHGPPPTSPPGGFAQPPAGYGTPSPGHGYPPPGPAQPSIPQQGPQYGPRPPQGPPPPRGPVQDFGPQAGPPFGPRGR